MSQLRFSIIVVDDDPRMRELLTRYLSAEGFEIFSAANAQEMDECLRDHKPNLIVLDLMLPGEDGLSICKRLRQKGDTTPIIMLTAKGDEVDRIVGLEVGADDYLAKPFNPRELLARINAVRRRSPSAEVGTLASEVLSFGDFVFDIHNRSLRKNGTEVPLTTGDYSMLTALARNPHVHLSREKLSLLARGKAFEHFDRSLDVQVSRLRKLIEDAQGSPRFIQTVWGVGYIFVPDDKNAKKAST